MAKVKVSIDQIEVVKDGDPSGKGELYWLFKADSTKITERSVSSPRKTASGEVVPIDKSTTITKNPGETLVVFGSVSDKDSGFDGADEIASFSLRHTENSNWGVGAFDERIATGALEVVVHGRIDLA